MDFFGTNRAKTLWRGQSKDGWSFLCPFCRASRKVAHRSTPSLRHYFQIALTAVFFTLITWSWFAWKGMVSFIPFWMIFEGIYRVRTRAVLSCPQCGFDPYLHLTDAQRSKQELEAYWKKRFAEMGLSDVDPEQLVSRSGVKSGMKEDGAPGAFQ